jgi:hypothetical protein
MSFKSLLVDKCDVISITTTQNGLGEEVYTEVIEYSQIPCRVVEGSINEFIENGLIRVSRRPYKIFIESVYDLTRLDLIQWNNVKLRSLNHKKDSSGHHYEIEAELITG